ncbi:M20 family metallo-hydrolase [Oleidesulfovibrio sp.]|uniref:M20 family metallo-hydrolase n=1 Tax=Oleidesulfovibrio sp. TaxID=2909707 RepID=UPI003A88984F
MLDTLFSYLDSQRETVVELQRELTAIPALCPQSEGIGEEAKAEFIIEKLREFGVSDIQTINAPDIRVPCGYRPNIVARIAGRDQSRTFWIISHMDVVPPGDFDLWESDPYTLRVDGDVLIGRGVEDNQQAIVSSLLMARALQKHAVVPDVNVGFLFVADEETGNTFGLDHVLATAPDLFKHEDLILVPDCGNADGTMLEVAEKSVLWLKVAVTGKQCHGSRPEEGINSLVGAAAMILKVQTLHDRFSVRNDLFVPPVSTFVPTKKDANVPNVNTVPGNDVFYIDCRVLPEYQLKDVINAVEELARSVEQDYGVSITVECVQKEQATTPTDSAAPVVLSLQQAVKAVYNADARPMGIGGGTVAAALRRIDLPAVVWSKIISNAHTPNERSLISANIGDAKVMLHVALNSQA